MTYQIDQSGKIEDTAKNTVLGLSNGNQRAIMISARVKRQLQEEFRGHGLTKIFIYQTFSAGIYFLIKEFKKQESIIIDLEYPGKDKIIKEMLLKILISHNKPVHEIHFARIGNHPKVHYVAKNVFDGKKEADHKISFGEIIRAIKTADGHLRECFSTLVDAQPRPNKRIISKKIKKSRHI